MKRFGIVLSVVVLVLVAAVPVFTGACGTGTTEEPSESTSAAPEVPTEIRIGDPVSYTGPYAAFGGLSSWGTEAAIADINDEGGIYLSEYDAKVPVRWIHPDCESDPTKLTTLTEDLILNEDVHFLGGHFEVPTLRQGTAMMADKYEIPAVYGLGTYEAWAGMHKAASTSWNYSWTFGFSIGTPAPEGDFRHGNNGYLMMPTWLGALGARADETNKKVAAFAFDDSDGRGWYKAFSAAAGEQGFNVYRVEDEFGIYSPGTQDFTSLVQEWKNNDCEILWGNCPGPDFGTLMKQCKAQGFEPKLVYATRAAMFVEDIAAWGGDMADGVGTEIYWSPSMQNAQGIGGTTPQSLAERYREETGSHAVPQGIGWCYAVAQTLFDAIERAGTLDSDAVLEALDETDYTSMWGRVVFEEGTGLNFQRVPCQFGQWQKTEEGWNLPVVFSYNDFMPAMSDMIFPKPWD
ncbi:MAG: ABC transporter substrate-binding protein [Dehalococcoidia bacterium]